MNCALAIQLARATAFGGVFLDVGAGTCPCRQPILEARPDLIYLAQDFAGYKRGTVQPEAASALLNDGPCKEGLDIVSDASDLQLSNSSVDAIYCRNVLEHVPDAVPVLHEAARVMKPGALAFYATTFGGGLHNLPFHFNGGFTHHFFEHHGNKTALKVVNYTYTVAPWTTDAERLTRLSQRFMPCLQQMYAAQTTVLQAAAFQAHGLQFCDCVSEGGCMKVQPSPASGFELEFPDALEVFLQKLPPLIKKKKRDDPIAKWHESRALSGRGRVGVQLAKLRSERDYYRKMRDHYDRLYHLSNRDEIAHEVVWHNITETCHHRPVRLLPTVTMMLAAAQSGDDFHIIRQLSSVIRSPQSPDQTEAVASADSSRGFCGRKRAVLQPFPTRNDTGAELRRLGLRGIGVEVGVQAGSYTYQLLKGWRQAELFIQIDPWMPLSNYRDSASAEEATLMRYMDQACKAGKAAVRSGWAGAVLQWKTFSSIAASHFADGCLDFVYLDARHDRKAVLEDLSAFWPKVRAGGVIAGHDYTTQRDLAASWDPASTGQDWTLSEDGTREAEGRAVKGAVEDFFSGEAAESPQDLRDCPRQTVITYRELSFNTWAVVK